MVSPTTIKLFSPPSAKSTNAPVLFNIYASMPKDVASYPSIVTFGFNIICGYFTKPGLVAYLVDIFLISLATGPNSFIHGLPVVVLSPLAKKSPKTFFRDVADPTYDP